MLEPNLKKLLTEDTRERANNALSPVLDKFNMDIESNNTKNFVKVDKSTQRNHYSIRNKNDATCFQAKRV